jgi:hypothetical protein
MLVLGVQITTALHPFFYVLCLFFDNRKECDMAIPEIKEDNEYYESLIKEYGFFEELREYARENMTPEARNEFSLWIQIWHGF